MLFTGVVANVNVTMCRDDKITVVVVGPGYIFRQNNTETRTNNANNNICQLTFETSFPHVSIWILQKDQLANIYVCKDNNTLTISHFELKDSSCIPLKVRGWQEFHTNITIQCYWEPVQHFILQYQGT